MQYFTTRQSFSGQSRSSGSRSGQPVPRTLPPNPHTPCCSRPSALSPPALHFVVQLVERLADILQRGLFSHYIIHILSLFLLFFRENVLSFPRYIQTYIKRSSICSSSISMQLGMVFSSTAFLQALNSIHITLSISSFWTTNSSASLSSQSKNTLLT